MRNRLAVFLVTMGSLALVSCGDDVSVPSDVATEWWLVSFVRPDRSTVSITASPEFSVRFAADGAMDIRVHCNTCQGSYQLQGGQLTGDLMGCTLARCQASPVDSTFQEVFDGRSSVTMADEHLTLTSERGTLDLQLAPGTVCGNPAVEQRGAE
jgi:heat shock protein HslJ